MQKLIKWFSIITIATLLALVILLFTLFRFEQTASTQHQMLGEMLWLSAPDGGVGFRILASSHPNYTIKIVCNTPDNLCEQGTYRYTGTELQEVEISDIASYLGESIGLVNGEFMVKISD